MAGKAIGVHDYDGENLRFLKVILLGENADFVIIELEKYIVTIAKDQIAKMEVAKLWRD